MTTQLIEGSKNWATSVLAILAIRPRKNLLKVNSPRNLQLPVANIGVGFVISGRAELDELGVARIPESQLCGFVESLDDGVEVLQELGLGQ